MKIKLTDSAVKTIAAPREGRIEIFDTLLSGFSLRVTANGVRTYVVSYRVKGDRSYRKRRFTIGTTDVCTLADARTKARDTILESKTGVDPHERRQAEIVEQARDNFAAVAHEFIERYCKVHQRSWTTTESIIKSKLSVWDGMQVAEIDRRDVLNVLDGLMDRDASYMANRTLAVIRKFFSWCIERGVVSVSPATNIKAPGKEQSRDRVLTDDELKLIWQAGDAVGYPFGPYVQVLMLTGQRRTELADMRRDHLNGNVWHLPLTKNGRAHDVPLTGKVREILKSLPVFEGPYLFTCTGGVKAINGFSKFKATLDKAAGVIDWRLHDLRRTASTGMAGQGVAPHVVERILNHTGGVISGVAAAYNRHSYETEMLAALESWARHIDGLINPKDNVRVLVRK